MFYDTSLASMFYNTSLACYINVRLSCLTNTRLSCYINTVLNNALLIRILSLQNSKYISYKYNSINIYYIV